MKAPIYLPSHYKRRTNTTVQGRAASGEISMNGLVSMTEDWEGRIAAECGVNAMRFVREPDGTFRRLTFREQVERGYFVVGKGPKGMK